MSFLPTEQHPVNALVCKQFLAVARQAEKESVIRDFKLSTRRDLERFARMVPKPPEEYSPSYCEGLRLIDAQKERLTIREIHQRLNSLVERRTVCLRGCFVIDPQSPAIPAALVPQVAGRAFAELNTFVGLFSPAPEGLWDVQPWAPIAPFQPPCKNVPVELLNITVEGPERNIIGEINQGTIGFVLRGRVILLNLVEGNVPALQGPIANMCQWGPYATRTHASFFEALGPDKDLGHVWLSDLYIPTRDAAPAETIATQGGANPLLEF
jgi:hypothetical protein